MKLNQHDQATHMSLHCSYVEISSVYTLISKYQFWLENNPTIKEQGSPHLQKTGRLDFSLRGLEGEVKAW
jgi:secreted trypsin-like serine protease